MADKKISALPAAASLTGTDVFPVVLSGDTTTYKATLTQLAAFAASGGSSGTVTSASVVSANGLAGTVATATTTPAITLTTTVNGMVKGNGTALSAATAETDYVTPTGAGTLTNKTLTSPVVNTPTGIVKGDVGLGNVDNTSNVTERAAAATLTNKTLTAPTLADSQLIRAMLIDCGATFLDKGNSGTTTQTLDYTAGSHQRITVTGAHSIATSNWPPTGNLGELLLELTNGAAHVVTWPTINWVKSDGSTTTTFASNGVTLQSSGIDWVLLWSRDAGTTIYGKIMR